MGRPARGLWHAHHLNRSDPRSVVLTGKAYNVDRISNRIEALGAAPNIPANAYHKAKPCFSKALDRERYLRDHVSSKFNNLQRIAIR